MRVMKLLIIILIIFPSISAAGGISFSESEINRISRGDAQINRYLAKHLAAIIDRRISEQPDMDGDEIKRGLFNHLRGLRQDSIHPELLKTLLNTNAKSIQDLAFFDNENFPEIVFVAKYALDGFESPCDLFSAYIEFAVSASEVVPGSLFNKKIECHLEREEIHLAINTLSFTEKLLDSYPSGHLAIGDYFHNKKDYAKSFSHYKQAGIIGYGERQLKHLERLSSSEYNEFDPERSYYINDLANKLAGRFISVNNYDSALRACKIVTIDSCGVNNKDSDGRTALMRAAWRNQPEKVARLIKFGASINIQDNDGVTALMSAAYKGNTSVVSILLENGADPLLKTKKWEYDAVLFAAERGHYATESGHQEILELLEKYVGAELVAKRKKEAETNRERADAAKERADRLERIVNKLTGQ